MGIYSRNSKQAMAQIFSRRVLRLMRMTEEFIRHDTTFARMDWGLRLEFSGV